MYFLVYYVWNGVVVIVVAARYFGKHQERSSEKEKKNEKITRYHNLPASRICFIFNLP